MTPVTTSAPMADGNQHVLALNSGSSSIKFALYRIADGLVRHRRGKLERMGTADGTFTVRDERDMPLLSAPVEVSDMAAAGRAVFDWCVREVGFASIAAVGHRVVSGGSRYSAPHLVDEELLEELRRLSLAAPEHLPAEIALIELIGQRAPAMPQVACFDTAFHRHMPRVARILPLPRRLLASGIERRGFHGLSYAFLMQELERRSGRAEAMGRVVLAHLGNGASLAAVHLGISIDTSMGVTPASGLPMGTRSGDLDPGLALHLANTEGMTPGQFDHMVNRESGLLGISGISGDLRNLLSLEATHDAAAEAVAFFCYQVKKWIGAYAAALGGLDTVVFAGGIGENAPEIRARICDGLAFLGVRIDPALNASGASLLSPHGSDVRVHVIRTDEEAMIAAAVMEVLRERALSRFPPSETAPRR